MKRLLIAGFLIMASAAAIFAVSGKSSKKADCIKKEDICCTKKCTPVTPVYEKTDYIFWEPMSRLILITNKN